MNPYPEQSEQIYSRPPRRHSKKYTQMLQPPKPNTQYNNQKSYRKIAYAPNDIHHTYDKQNSRMNCKSNVNIQFHGEKRANAGKSMGKCTRERSSSIMGKSQVNNTVNNYPPYEPANKPKTASRWETIDYTAHQNIHENYDSNQLTPEIVPQSRNKTYSKGAKLLQKYNSMGRQNYFEKSAVTFNTPLQEDYPRFGIQTKTGLEYQNPNTKSSKNIPLYERLKGYGNQSTLGTETSQSYLHKTFSYYDNKQYADIKVDCYPMNETAGGFKYSDYTSKISKPDLYSSVKPKIDTNPPLDYTLAKKVSNKTDILKQPQLDDFIIGQCKGQGRFGKVYMAIHKKTGFLCALKKIKKQSVKYMIDQFIQEVKIQLYLNHPKLVKVYGYFSDKQHFYMLVQYMEEGSLYSLMKKHKKFEEQETSQKMYEICLGIKEMHDQNIVHRDLKPENVVMSHGVCKICDFGWAAICQDRRQTYCGTLDYVCPEIVQGNTYDSSADIWCIGVLAYELMVGKAPFYDISRQKTIQKIKSCKIDSYPPHLSKKAINFIQMILKKNPDSRVGIQQLLDSQFLRQCKK